MWPTGSYLGLGFWTGVWSSDRRRSVNLYRSLYRTLSGGMLPLSCGREVGVFVKFDLGEETWGGVPHSCHLTWGRVCTCSLLGCSRSESGRGFIEASGRGPCDTSDICMIRFIRELSSSFGWSFAEDEMDLVCRDVRCQLGGSGTVRQRMCGEYLAFQAE